MPRAIVQCNKSDVLDEPDDARLFSHGKIFVPAAHVPVRGFVIASHGQMLPNSGQQIDLYKVVFDYLLECLAANGYVAVAVKSCCNPEERRQLIKDSIVPSITAAAERGVPADLIPKRPFILIGHSESVTSVLSVAVDLNSGQNLPEGIPLKTVATIIALAPSWGGDVISVPAVCDSLFVLGGTHDEQTLGSDCRFFDAMDSKAYFSCSMWFRGFRHFSFSDVSTPGLIKIEDLVDLPPDPDRAMSRSAANFVASQLITTFLRWRLAGEGWGDIFQNGWVPALVSGDPVLDAEIKEKLVITWQYAIKLKGPIPVQQHCGAYTCIQFLDIKDENGDFATDRERKPLRNLWNLWPMVCPSSRPGYRLIWTKEPPNASPKVTITPNGLPGDYRYLEFDLAQTLGGEFSTSEEIPFRIVLFIATGKDAEKAVVAPYTYWVQSAIDVARPPNPNASIGQTRPHTYKIGFAECGILQAEVAQIVRIEIDFALDSGPTSADLLMSEVRFAFY